MGDLYVECLVSRDRDNKIFIERTAMYVLGGAFCLASFVTTSIFLIVGIVLIVLGYALFNPDYEYEYLLLNKELTIDKIIAKQKRKTVAEYDLSKMEVMCPINSHELDSYKARKVSMKNFDSGKADAKPYVIVLKDENGDQLICIEPNEELMKTIKTVCPRKVVEY